MRKSLQDITHMVKNISYPGQLPDELKPYHYYIADQGHCVMCVLECHLREARILNWDDYELPVPVKYILEKGYHKQGDYIIVNVPYDPNIGMVVDEKYYEFQQKQDNKMDQNTEVLRHLQVGKLFESGRTHYDEGLKFEFEQSGPILFIFFNRPTEKEIETIRAGKFKIGFYETEGIIFILSKFGSLKWFDTPYNIHLSPPIKFAEELDANKTLGFGLQIFLIDAATGILKVIRYIGLGHDFSIRLRDEMLKQKQSPFNQDTYIFRLNELYKRYSTDQLVEYARYFFKIE